MSYFAAALLALLVAEGLMVSGFGFPFADLRAPETLVLVHLAAIGWLSLLMCGALFQFVPVLVAKPIYSNRLPLLTLIFLLLGLAGLLAGFLQLAGHFNTQRSFLPIGGTLLGLGIVLVLWNLGRTLWSGRPLPLPARFVAAGLVGLAATASYGIIFTLVLGGAPSSGPLAILVVSGVPVHAALGLGGWLTITAMGVSYRLLAMFMLAPELDGRRPRTALWLGAIALALLIAGATAAICLGAGIDAALAAAGLLGLAAAVLYGADIAYLYRARKRRTIELNSRMAVPALASFAAAIVLIVLLVALGRLADQIGAVVFLTVFGWLSGLGLAKLYKIVPFMTWLECYGPILGKAKTPRVQDLVVERRARKWFVLHYVAVWSGTIVLLLNLPMAFRFAALGMIIAAGGIIAELLRARRLSDIPAASRLAETAARPRLLMSLVS